MTAGYTAHLELQTGLIRVFDPGREFGQEYARSWYVVRITDTLAEIRGADHMPSADMMRAMAHALDRAGFAEVQWTRKKGGESHVRRYPLAKWLDRPAG